MQLVSILLVGPPGVGKSSLSHGLVGKVLPNHRRSSAGISFSPKLEAKSTCNDTNTFTWTPLTFNQVLQRVANLIAPIVVSNLGDDQIAQPQISNVQITNVQRMVKFMKKRFTRIPFKFIKSTSVYSDSPKNSLSARSASVDNLVCDKVLTKENTSDQDDMKTFITIMDSGGQKAFLNLYPIFVRNPSLVLIVFKMTNDPDCIWKPLPKDEFYTSDRIFTNLHQINHSAADLIKHTMANISTYTDFTNSSTMTHICCVGTHKDQVSEGVITAIDKQLTCLVQESGYASLVVTREGKSTKTLFPVNNLVAGHPDASDQVVEELKEIPVKCLRQRKNAQFYS